MSTATRRITRRTAASAEPAQSASVQGAQQESTPPPELPKKKARKTKATSAHVESQTVTESQQTVTKTRATSRANVTPATTTTTSTTAKTTIQTPAVGRTTRNRKAAAAANGVASPLRSLDEKPKPVKRGRGTAYQKLANEQSKPVQAESSADDENGEDEAPFFSTKFDHDLMLEATQAEPEFVNGSESALALLHKIENNAKGAARIHSSSIHDSETSSNNDVTMENSPQQSAKRTFTDVSATPERPVAKNPSFFSRSFSAITSRFFSTPKAPSTSTPDVISTAPPKPLPAQDTFTESLSVPPTPIGERVKTPSKRRTPINTMMRVLLKGVDDGERQKAEAWAKQIIPELKNDPAFREKRKRLEKTVLFKDLTHFPSAKPWEAGFGDPLGDLDDDDAVPGWAVYLNMKAEEEEHQPKKHKKTHDVTTRNDEIPSLNEQFAASNGARTPPKLYNSHGQSASLYDFHPRRSIDPSPMFATSVSHNEGNNLFSELHTHDSAAQIRESDREILKNATRETVHTHHNPGMGSFSVPDDSDEDDSPVEDETSGAETTPLWTQPPPPAPVPAHAPLPGGPVADSPSVPPTPQPEIERQRQRLMKHTPAKPSRLREATYPSPSLLSEAGNNSPLVATSAHIPADFASMFSDMPGAELIELDEEEQAAFDEIVSTEEYKRQLTANNWPAATLSYESDEEDLSPVSAQGFDNA